MDNVVRSTQAPGVSEQPRFGSNWGLGLEDLLGETVLFLLVGEDLFDEFAHALDHIGLAGRSGVPRVFQEGVEGLENHPVLLHQIVELAGPGRGTLTQQFVEAAGKLFRQILVDDLE